MLVYAVLPALYACVCMRVCVREMVCIYELKQGKSQYHALDSEANASSQTWTIAVALEVTALRMLML